MKKRAGGILLPISSLPSPYGIGCFSKEAYEFVDFLKAAGQTYWQILPLGPTGFGDSPYQCCSTFAGNPYFIDLSAFCRLGFLNETDINAYDFGKNPGMVDYAKIYKSRKALFWKAYQNSPFALANKGKRRSEKEQRLGKAFAAFCRREADWLNDYALFCALKDHTGVSVYQEWEPDILHRTEEGMSRAKKLCEDEIRFHKFLQFFFQEQWDALKAYAKKKGIRIIGDLPIYVALDSADTWSKPELFYLDKDYRPTQVAGCPPDAFSKTGQLWGNPIYRWSAHKKENYAWWIARMKRAFALYDCVRLDHFRGFEAYYSIPAGEETAEHGTWKKGPGIVLFQALEAALGELPIIAEDLGVITPKVEALREETGFPGMKVLQFAFDPKEDSDHLPHNYTQNCVAYTGTHDNQTSQGWFDKAKKREREKAILYLQLGKKTQVAESFVRCVLGSVANTAIIPMQDYLGLGDIARMNTPSTLGGKNWCWRVSERALTKERAKEIKKWMKFYGRDLV